MIKHDGWAIFKAIMCVMSCLPNLMNITPALSVLPCSNVDKLTLTVLVTTIDKQWEGMGDVGSAKYELALLPPCPTIRVLRYSN